MASVMDLFFAKTAFPFAPSDFAKGGLTEGRGMRRLAGE